MDQERRFGPTDHQQAEHEEREREAIAALNAKAAEILAARCVRAKFRVNSYETSLFGSLDHQEECRTVKLTAVTDGSEENKRFFKYTPNGTISIGLLSPSAWKQFELGASYFVDFTRTTD